MTPRPLPPLWLFSMAYTCLLFCFFVSLLSGVGWAEREAWVGGGPSEDAPGVETTTNKARTQGFACFAMCLRCASQENINTCDSSPEILLPLSFFFLSFDFFWQPRVTQKTKKRGRTCVVFVSSHVLLQTFWKEKKKKKKTQCNNNNNKRLFFCS